MEKTLVLIKPDAMKAHHIGDIFKIYEEKGLQVLAVKMLQMYWGSPRIITSM